MSFSIYLFNSKIDQNRTHHIIIGVPESEQYDSKMTLVTSLFFVVANKTDSILKDVSLECRFAEQSFLPGIDLDRFWRFKRMFGLYKRLCYCDNDAKLILYKKRSIKKGFMNVWHVQIYIHPCFFFNKSPFTSIDGIEGYGKFRAQLVHNFSVKVNFKNRESFEADFTIGTKIAKNKKDLEEQFLKATKKDKKNVPEKNEKTFLYYPTLFPKESENGMYLIDIDFQTNNLVNFYFNGDKFIKSEGELNFKVEKRFLIPNSSKHVF